MSAWSRATTAFAAAGALALAGCATVPRGDAALAAPTFAGRLSVQVEADGAAPARSFSAAFELRGDARTGHLDLSTPLGSVLAQARWSPTQVVLATPRGETGFADLDALTTEVLGESLPLAALFDWLQGRPWPGAPSVPATAADAPGASEMPASAEAHGADGGFRQLGWTVSLARFDDGLVTARRKSPPPVTVRIKLDRR